MIVGRIEVENDFLFELLVPDYWNFHARDFQGPVVFALDTPEDEDFLKISAITARYGKGIKEKKVVILAKKGEEKREFEVKPASQEETDLLLISKG